MAAEDRARLRELLLPPATAVLAPRAFDLTLDEAGIQLILDGRISNIATAAEIADGTFKAVFTRRLCEAAGIETPKSAEETGGGAQRKGGGEPRNKPVLEAARPQGDTRREVKVGRERQIATSSGDSAGGIPLTHPVRSPLPKWVTEAVEETGASNPHAPAANQLHSRHTHASGAVAPVCVPTMRLTRRAQQILDEINERHRES
jgi:hypothetical protein